MGLNWACLTGTSSVEIRHVYVKLHFKWLVRFPTWWVWCEFFCRVKPLVSQDSAPLPYLGAPTLLPCWCPASGPRGGLHCGAFSLQGTREPGVMPSVKECVWVDIDIFQSRILQWLRHFLRGGLEFRNHWHFWRSRAFSIQKFFHCLIILKTTVYGKTLWKGNRMQQLFLFWFFLLNTLRC